MQNNFLIVILEAPIPSIWCKLCFQAVIALRNATIHFWWQSQDLRLRTHKGSKTKTELKSSFLYVLVRLKYTAILLIWAFYITINLFPKIRWNFFHSVPHHPGTKVAMVQVDQISMHQSTLWMLLRR